MNLLAKIKGKRAAFMPPLTYFLNYRSSDFKVL